MAIDFGYKNPIKPMGQPIQPLGGSGLGGGTGLNTPMERGTTGIGFGSPIGGGTGIGGGFATPPTPVGGGQYQGGPATPLTPVNGGSTPKPPVSAAPETTPKDTGDGWFYQDYGTKQWNLPNTAPVPAPGAGRGSTPMYNPEEGLYRDPRGNETKVFDMSAYDKYRLTDSHGFPETGQSFRGPGGGGEASGDPAVGAPPGYRRDPISGYYYPDWAFAQAEGLGQQQGGNVGAQEPALLDPEQYGPTVMDLMMQDALNKHWGLSGRYDELLGAAPDLSGGQRNALSQAETAGDWYFDQGQDSYGLAKDYFAQAGAAGDQWYGAGWDSYGKADGLIDQQVAALNYAKEGNQWYDDYTRNQLTQAADMTGSGVIPKAMEDAMMGSMNRMLESSMGQMMNDMAGRGVINSSVNTTGMANLGKQAANAYQDNYLQTFDTLLKGIQGNAAQGISGGDTFGRTNLGIAAGYGDASGNARQLGDSYVGAGSQRTTDLLNVGNAYNNNANSLMQAGSGRINDWLNIGQGYDQALNTNIRERESVMNQMPQNWQNALGPAGIVPGLLEQLLSDWANTGGRTTVVS